MHLHHGRRISSLTCASWTCPGHPELAPALLDPETAGDPQFDYGVDDPSFLPEQPDVGAQEPDAIVGAYYYMETADDQE